MFGGCAQLAGIDDTSGDGLVAVSLAVERVSIGSTVVRSPQDLSASSATYLVADPADPSLVTSVVAVETEPGLWTAPIFDATPPVVFDLPDGLERQLTLPNKAIVSAFDVLEHPDPVASALTDTFTVSATLDTPFAAETFELLVIGTWTARALEAPLAASLTLAPPTFTVETMTSLTGRPLEQITPADTALILRRSGATLNGVIEVSPFAQTPTNALMGSFATLAADRILSVQIDPITAANRLGIARPAITAGPVFSYSLHAAPGAEVGLNAGPLLTSGLAALIDTSITAAYPNPFVARSWSAVLSFSATGSRTVVPNGQTLQITLAAQLQQRVADPAAGLTLDFPAGIPEQISIAGQSLSIDNVALTQPTTPVEVTIIVDRPGATLLVLEVRELIPNAAGDALIPARRLLATSVESTFVIQPEVFEVGKIYSLRVQTFSGLFLDIANGDVSTRALPVATAFVDSGVFRVVLP